MVIRKEFRKKIAGETGDLVVYDAMAETAADLQDLTRAAMGSLVYVLDGGKLYVKRSNGTWEAVR